MLNYHDKVHLEAKGIQVIQYISNIIANLLLAFFCWHLAKQRLRKEINKE